MVVKFKYLVKVSLGGLRDTGESLAFSNKSPPFMKTSFSTEAWMGKITLRKIIRAIIVPDIFKRLSSGLFYQAKRISKCFFFENSRNS